MTYNYLIRELSILGKQHVNTGATVYIWEKAEFSIRSERETWHDSGDKRDNTVDEKC